MKHVQYLQRSDKANTLNFIVKDNTIWATYGQIAELYDCSERNIIDHIETLFRSMEFNESSVTQCYRVTASDGKTYQKKHFNLEIIYAVGYRVRSEEAMEFRKWATEHLMSIRNKGYSLDNQQLDEDTSKLLNLINDVKELRKSEAVAWKGLITIIASSVDFDKSLRFVQRIQNMLHYATHGHTAPELIYERVDHTKPLMGMLSFPGPKPLKSDIIVAKNYMTEDELAKMDRLTISLLELTKDLQPVSRDAEYWETKIKLALDLRDAEILTDHGTISREIANAKVFTEFALYRQANVNVLNYVTDANRYILDLKEFNSYFREKYDFYYTNGAIASRYMDFGSMYREVVLYLLVCFNSDFRKFKQKVKQSVIGHPYFDQHGTDLEILDFMSSLADFIFTVVKSSIELTVEYEVMPIEIQDNLAIVEQEIQS